ncbi:MAG: S-layer homology domain-containing protein, partial [Oscillospiraceae bacterium]|nr:S-layer homology domain-containing protein [Oscillospiraceae bacterium]
YYNSAVAWAYENGITTGTSDSTFSPADDCTRAQVVTFLYRYAVK